MKSTNLVGNEHCMCCWNLTHWLCARKSSDGWMMLIMYRVLLLFAWIRLSVAAFCLTGTMPPKSTIEHFCDAISYRTAFVGGRCFIGVISTNELTQPCAQLILRPEIGTEPRLAHIDSQALVTSLKQTDSFDPKRCYQVASNIDGSSYWMAPQQSQGYSYLCETSGWEACLPDEELWNGLCYRFVAQATSYSQAKQYCTSAKESSFRNATLAIAIDKTTNQFLASFASSAMQVLGMETSPIWVNLQYNQSWSVSQKDAYQAPSFYHWTATNNGMMKSVMSSTAVRMHLSTNEEEGGALFGYWDMSVDADSDELPYICQLMPLDGNCIEEPVAAKPSPVVWTAPPSVEPPSWSLPPLPVTHKSTCRMALPPLRRLHEMLIRVKHMLLQLETSSVQRCKSVYGKPYHLQQTCFHLAQHASLMISSC